MTADELASLLGHRECRQQVTPEQILRALGTTPRHKNRALLIDIVSDASQGVRSALERRYLHDVERAHGLPTAQRQATPVGIYMVDNLYEDQDVIVELDSQAYHRGPAAGRDFERDRVHERNGFVTLRYTWKDVVDRPCRTADEIATTLAGRGWTGHLTRCPRCRAAHV
jgi:very-short-patch-repair endonuclease